MNKLRECICDRCRRVICQAFGIFPEDPMYFKSKNKKTEMHFCSDQCKLTFLKGRKYWNRKRKQHDANVARLQRLSEKCL